MSDDWGNDPIQDTPVASDWGNDPLVGPAVKFSEDAVRRAIGRPGSVTVHMDPHAYLALTPEFVKNPKTDKKGADLQKSLARGDQVDEVPGLEVVVGKDGTARVTDQDGRHRAQAAIDAGLTEIPVVVQRFGDKAPIKSLVGMRDGAQPVPFNFKPVTAPVEPTPPKRVIPTIAKSGSFASGMRDPLESAAQLLTHVLPTPVLRAGNELNNALRDVGVPLTKMPTSGDMTLDPYERQREVSIQADREKAGETGVDWDRLAGNIASPANLLVAGRLGLLKQATPAVKSAAPVLTRLVKTAATSGAGGAIIAALNPVTGGDFWSDKTKQTAVGLVAGTFVPPVFRLGAKAVIKTGSAVTAPLIRLVSGVRGPNAVLDAADQEILRRLTEGVEGGGPTATEMLHLASKTPGKPLTLMDVGSQPVNALAGRIARTQGPAAQVVGDFLGERTAAQGQRLEGDVGTHVGKGSAHDTVVAMQQSRAHAASPLYTKAFEANQNIQSPVIDKILETPAGKEALSRARIKMQNDMELMGAPDKDLADQAREAGQVIPGGKVASGLKLRTLDYVKRAYDGMATAALKAGDADEYRIIDGQRKALIRALDEADITARAGPNSVKPEGGLYRQARAAYSGPSRSMEAVEFGQNALKPGTSIEENAAHFRDMNANDQEFARVGLANALREQIATVNVGNNAARKLALNRALQARIGPFFKSKGDYEKFMDAVDAEHRMFMTDAEILRGSQTARRMAEDSDPRAEALGHAAHAGIKFSMGNHLGGMKSLLQSANVLSKLNDPALATQIARTLTAPLNEQGSRGLKLLRDFAAVAPGTRNYLAQATNRAARTSVLPVGVLAGQQPPQP